VGIKIKTWPPPQAAQARKGWSPRRRAHLFLIVVTTGENADFVIFNLINQAVFFVGATGPAAGQFVFKRFWLAGADKRITLNLIADQIVDGHIKDGCRLLNHSQRQVVFASLNAVDMR
jgi:hypothetical protein